MGQINFSKNSDTCMYGDSFKFHMAANLGLKSFRVHFAQRFLQIFCVTNLSLKYKVSTLDLTLNPIFSQFLLMSTIMISKGIFSYDIPPNFLLCGIILSILHVYFFIYLFKDQINF